MISGPVTSREEDESTKKMSVRLWLVIAGLGITTLVFLILFAVTASSKSSLQEELNEAEDQNDVLEDNVQTASQALDEAINNITSFNKTILILRNKIANLTQTLNGLMQTSNSQQEQIAAYQRGNTYLWIGGGSGLALGAGAGGLGIYERNRGKTLAANLTLTTERYEHFYNFYSLSYFWLVEDYVLYYYSTLCQWKTLYHSDSGWNHTAIVNSLKGANNTATFIMTDTDYLIAAILPSTWKDDSKFIEDAHAFTMSVNNVWECPIAKEASKEAARLNTAGAIFEFGNREIAIFPNRTGYAMADVTYSCAAYFPEKFYAEQTRFNVKWLHILQFAFAPTLPVLQNQFRNLVRH